MDIVQVSAQRYTPSVSQTHLLVTDIDGFTLARFTTSTPVYNTTISGGRTVLINSAGTFGAIVSSERYKENIRIYNDAENKILNVNPVFFDFKKEVVEADTTEDERNNQFGLIAEHLYDANLIHLLYFNKNGQPESIKYEMLGVELLQIVKKQDSLIKNLTQRIEVLEKKLYI
jgi:hypothetical protein